MFGIDKILSPYNLIYTKKAVEQGKHFLEIHGFASLIRGNNKKKSTFLKYVSYFVSGWFREERYEYRKNKKALIELAFHYK